ncbi:hypothetical protein FRC08_007114 [Ceratobasidium sp. 394]|nr:hypothetical protein FRC08_007114 [Ceratobasidium sp. 394]
MLKRKIVAGGYEESSDDSESELLITKLDAPTKKLKATSYTPLRISTAPTAGAGTFRFPRHASATAYSSALPSSVASSSLYQKVSDSSIPFMRAASESQVNQQMLIRTHKAIASDFEPNGAALSKTHVDVEANAKGGTSVTKPSIDPTSAPAKSSQIRSTIAMEQQLNEIKSDFDDYKTLNNEQHKCTHETLAQLVEAVNHLASAGSVTSAPSSLTSFAPSPTVSSAKPYLSNPMPTPELIEVISKVVTKARNRVGKKKGGSEDNSLKEHAHNMFYRMLGITAAKAIQPYFKDDLGNPDTLPVQFIDPETNYCQPYPHWKAPLTKQVAWIPTYLLHFRSTVPKDCSDLSAALGNLTDEQIIILLNDGLFKTAQTAWRDMKKTDKDLEIMRANSRRYQKTERKATTHAQYIKMIPALRGPEWEYLSHPGYMSQDKSDNEGVVTNNLYEAIRIAQLAKVKAQPGLGPRPLSRQIEVARCPVPHLKRGTGSNKVTICISLCGISKSWRDQYPGKVQKYSHLINPKAATKPNIDAFLAEHPMPNNSDSDLDDAGDNPASGWGEEAAVQLGTGDDYAGGEDVLDVANGKGMDDGQYMKDEGSGYQVRDVDNAGNTSSYGGDGQTTVGSDIRMSIANIPIDPALIPPLRTRWLILVVRLSQAPQRCQFTRPSVGGVPSVHAQAAPEQSYEHSSFLHSQMPPPPLPPSSDPKLTADGAILGDNGIGSCTRQMKQPIGNNPASSVAVTQVQVDFVQGSSTTVQPDAPQPKRRGRPLGSKNKPKVTTPAV